MSADFEFKEEEEEKAMRREALRPRRACCRDLAIDGDDMASRGVIDIGEDEASQVRVGGGFSFLTAPLIEVITPSMAVVSAAHQSPPHRCTTSNRGRRLPWPWSGRPIRSTATILPAV